MNVVAKLSLASVLAMSMAAPALAQSPQQGDYYKPGPATPQIASPAQRRRAMEGDYYDTTVGTKISAHRMAALRTCTSGIKFESNRYVSCMLKEGETP